MIAGWREIFVWSPFVFIAACASGCLLSMSAIRMKPRTVAMVFAVAAVLNLALLDLIAYRSAVTIGLIAGCIAGSFIVALRSGSMAPDIAVAVIGVAAGLGEIGRWIFDHGSSLLFEPRITGFIHAFLAIDALLIIILLSGLYISRRIRAKWPIAAATIFFLSIITDAAIALPLAIAFLFGFFGAHQGHGHHRSTMMALILSVFVESYDLLMHDLLVEQAQLPISIYFGEPNHAIAAVFSVPTHWYFGICASELAASGPKTETPA